MESSEIIDLLSLNAAILRDELTLMESGILKCERHGSNVTFEQAVRLRANLARLEAIIEAQREMVA